MQVIEAQVMDATHLELTSPIQVPRGSKVVISIVTPEIDKEHKEWIEMSLQRLQSAYGPDEPDYLLTRISAPNPEFEP
jgi:hypothetical protein